MLPSKQYAHELDELVDRAENARLAGSCRDMFLEAAHANATLLERRLMWCTALARLVSDVARSYLPADGFEADRRLLMLTGFLKRCQAHVNEVEGSLEKPWSEVEALSHQFFVR